MSEEEEKTDSPEEKTPYGVPVSQIRSVGGRLKTQALFLETNYSKESVDPAPFTLKERDHKGKISLKRIYMEVEDPTEYHFAMIGLGSWDHWNVLKSAPFFQSHLKAWREELDTKIRADAILTLKEDAVKNPVSARWLAERGWAGAREGGKKVGRKSKQDIANEVKRQAELEREIEEAGNRVFGDGE